MDELEALTERLDELEQVLVHELSVNSDGISAFLQKQAPFVGGILKSVEESISTAEESLDFDLNCDAILKATIQRRNIKALLKLLKQEQIKHKHAV